MPSPQRPQPTLLVTGFEPFGGAPTNTSQLVIEHLATHDPDPNRVEAVLPVSFARAPTHLAALLAAHSPDHVLLIGESAQATIPRLELYAHNTMTARAPDADGYTPHAVPIDPSGPDLLPTTLDIPTASAAAGHAGHTLELGEDAGTFVCNALFYKTQLRLRASSTHSGLLHVPATIDPAAIAALADLVRTLLAAVA
jgi:pyroglutamyl-peptidase